MARHMDELHRLMQEITQLTTNIAVNYPELYRNLDENPLTLPTESHPEIDVKVLVGYLETLKVQLRDLLENHRLKP